MTSKEHAQHERIYPHDASFNLWNERGANARFAGSPEYIEVILDVAGLTAALQRAVEENKYVVIRSGGHCLERFVSNDEVEVIIDISKMKGVTFDTQMNAFEVMAGTTVGETCQALYEKWNVVLPLGEYPKIGIGGHILGGAFGFLCRQHGLAVDYLCALELLWVDKDRKVSKLIATNQPDDPNREIWWAHTGGGAGNRLQKVKALTMNGNHRPLKRLSKIIDSIE